LDLLAELMREARERHGALAGVVEDVVDDVPQLRQGISRTRWPRIYNLRERERERERARASERERERARGARESEIERERARESERSRESQSERAKERERENEALRY
jgi:hypothetical protein